MPVHFVFPPDPNCPGYIREVVDLVTSETTDREIHIRETIHRAKCERCQKYSKDNVDRVVT